MLLKLNPLAEPFGGDNPAWMYGMEEECRMDGRFVADDMISEILLKTMVFLEFRNIHLSPGNTFVSSATARKQYVQVHLSRSDTTNSGILQTR